MAQVGLQAAPWVGPPSARLRTELVVEHQGAAMEILPRQREPAQLYTQTTTRIDRQVVFEVEGGAMRTPAGPRNQPHGADGGAGLGIQAGAHLPAEAAAAAV